MARRVFIAVTGAAVAIACSDNPLKPGALDAALNQQAETPGLVFRFAPGDAVDSAWQQRFHERLTADLGVQPTARLTYYKYRDRTHLRELTGRETNGFAEPEALRVHSIFAHDGHEAVHVYTALVGRPSNFFNEGLAVALNSEPDVLALRPRWNGTHVYAHTQLLRRTGQFRPLETMVTTERFRSTDEWIGYGEAGSFVLFLIEQHGLGPMVAFLRVSSQGDSLARIDEHVRTYWGMTLGEAEAAWLSYVDAWTE